MPTRHPAPSIMLSRSRMRSKCACSTYLHIQHLLMFNICACSTYVHVQHVHVLHICAFKMCTVNMRARSTYVHVRRVCTFNICARSTCALCVQASLERSHAQVIYCNACSQGCAAGLRECVCAPGKCKQRMQSHVAMQPE